MSKTFNIATPGFILILPLLLTSCIPIFSGEGDEVKSVQPGTGTSGVSVNGVSFVSIEMAHPERTFLGNLVANKDGRQIPIRYAKVCLLDKIKNEVECCTSDEMGHYKLVIRLAQGDYYLVAKSAGLAKEEKVKIVEERQFLKDFSY